ncbi:MAG: hydroxymethylglutaryl-CoA lyase [Bdellovibrionales bacterium GWA2_49_15]|nr:MAG: hydroxymethylglutaryl-CoA lyase [Bdellovibrionales bacterium GWA2_49_15]
MKPNIRIVEVGARDGLQNERRWVETADKIKFIQLLIEAGLTTVEAGSFVRADKIPQMKDTPQVYEGLPDGLKKKYSLPCLVPNMKGFESAMKVGVREIALFTSISESFNAKNIGASIEESLERFRPVALAALAQEVKIRGYISTAFGCPYEGATSLETLKKVANRLFDYGVYEISFGDTIGVAYPDQVRTIVQELKHHFDIHQLTMHFHDTYGLAMANVCAAYEEGVRSFDASAGGLGGCPFAKGATGNVATEDVLHLFLKMGLTTGIDMQKLLVASEFIFSKLNRPSQSKAHQAYRNKYSLCSD